MPRTTVPRPSKQASKCTRETRRFWHAIAAGIRSDAEVLQKGQR